MDAIVMAAGEGTRLRPLTERWPKPVLPIDGRPVIATLLRELATAGCTRAFVVTGYLAAEVEQLVGDGSGFGLEVRFVHQPSVLGSADVVQRALAAGATPPVLVSGADTVFVRGDVGRFLAASDGFAGALACRRDPPPEPPHRFAVRVEGGRVTRVLDDDPANPLSGAPLWVLGHELPRFLEGLPGPPFELAGGLQRAIDAGHAVAGVEIGPTRDLTHAADVIVQNFTYLGALTDPVH
jgi:UDP-N-acetylglucosamine diphosphorylase / glucose-1-phosphate thymidylyltransferase / UDP-N-acetylgalactosamine diphosphorylase / glucosamine-1-phosphate N-acetyltransferase / galactosamine-1-phosphate N-acetyltransferase